MSIPWKAVARSVAVSLLIVSSARAQCVFWDTGDCNHDGVVTVDELVRGVSLALNPANLASCTAFDPNGSGTVSVDELVQGVNNALTSSNRTYLGYGKNSGGAGNAPFHVNTTADTDTGCSLRVAIGATTGAMTGASNRNIVFDVGGDFVLGDAPLPELKIRGQNVTISGWGAPWPGVTIKHRALLVGAGSQNVVITNIRVRTTLDDAIRVEKGAKKVVVDHVSLAEASDDNFSVVSGTSAGQCTVTDATRTSDVTLGNSLLMDPVKASGALIAKQMTLGDLATRVSVHHNAFIESDQMDRPSRNPEQSFAAFPTTCAVTADTDISLDFINNVIYGWGGYGTRIRMGTRANVEYNLYDSRSDGISDNDDDDVVVCSPGQPNLGCGANDVPANGVTALAFVYGNVNKNTSPSVPDVNAVSDNSGAFSVPAAAYVNPDPTLVAACNVLASGGARYRNPSTGNVELDSYDQTRVQAAKTALGCP